MLNREAQEIHPAKLKFDVCGDPRRLLRSVQQCDYYVAQYFINNTCLDLTVVDTFGVRQTLPRRANRSGDRVFQVIREYRFVKTLEQESKDFFDEIAEGDGPILMALKELVEKEDIFRVKGFTTTYSQTVQTGFLLMVIFEIDENQISEYKTVDSLAIGVTVSRLRREFMPANPVYAAVNSGSYYNPFKCFLSPEYKMTRIFANYHAHIKERFWYNLGDIPIEVEYTNIQSLDEGIHIQAYTKQEDSETASNSTIKIVKFEEAFNKNGFFTSQRDAMLGSNTIRSERERDSEIRERTRQREIEASQAEERLVEAKRQLAIVKQESDELTHQRQLKLAEVQHEQAIELENQKRDQTRADHQLVVRKAGLAALQLDRDVLGFHQESHISEIKHKAEVLKIQGGAIKHAQEVELATIKHRATMVELERTSILSEAQHLQKLTMVEIDLATSASGNKRRLLEENTKMVTSVAGGLTTIGKLLL